MSIPNKSQNAQNITGEDIQFHSNDIQEKKIGSEKMFDNFYEDCGSEGVENNGLYINNVPTVRIKNENLMTHTINFDEAMKTIKNKQITDFGIDINHKNIEINDNSNIRETGNLKLKEEVKMIEEHFINSNRDFKPILYDEDLNAIIEEEKLKQSKSKNNKFNIVESKNENNNEIINKLINFNFRENMIQNKAYYQKEEDNINNNEDEINFRNKNNKDINILVKKGNEYNNNLNVDKHFKDTQARNNGNDNFLNSDDVLIVSFIEDKMSERKGIFYGLNKIYLFVNKRSGAQEGNTILEITSKHHKNFEVNTTDINLFNELYHNIYIVKLSQTNKKSKETEDIYVFVIDLLDSDKKSSGIESLRIESAQGKRIFLKINKIDESVKILIAGGDGTVLQVVEELYEKNIPIERCIFGHIPLGTGNDLSNSMGFGSQIYKIILLI